MAKQKPTTLEFPLKALLRDRASGAKIPAIVRPMVESDIRQWGEWTYENDDQDAGWEWDKILNEPGRSSGGIECYALCAEDRLHGLASFDLRGRATSAGHGLVIDYLATNPCNRRANGGVKDIGKVFLGLAVHRSRELGWNGRIWLESLSNAERFYERVGFAKLAARSEEGNAAFELGKVGADRIWRDIRDEKTLLIPDWELEQTEH